MNGCILFTQCGTISIQEEIRQRKILGSITYCIQKVYVKLSQVLLCQVLFEFNTNAKAYSVFVIINNRNVSVSSEGEVE